MSKTKNGLKILGVIAAIAFVIGIVTYFINFEDESDTFDEMVTKTDFFRGKFFPSNEIDLIANETLNIKFVIQPLGDASNTTVVLIPESKSLIIVKGDHKWSGDLKKDQILELEYTIMMEKTERTYLIAVAKGEIFPNNVSGETTIFSNKYSMFLNSSFEEPNLFEVILSNNTKGG